MDDLVKIINEEKEKHEKFIPISYTKFLSFVAKYVYESFDDKRLLPYDETIKKLYLNNTYNNSFELFETFTRLLNNPKNSLNNCIKNFFKAMEKRKRFEKKWKQKCLKYDDIICFMAFKSLPIQIQDDNSIN